MWTSPFIFRHRFFLMYLPDIGVARNMQRVNLFNTIPCSTWLILFTYKYSKVEEWYSPCWTVQWYTFETIKIGQEITLLTCFWYISIWYPGFDSFSRHFIHSSYDLDLILFDTLLSVWRAHNTNSLPIDSL